MQKIQRLIALHVLMFSTLFCFAQDYGLPINKDAKPFEKNFLLLFNDAPNAFMQYKGRFITDKDSIHQQSKIYECKLKLPGAKQHRYVQDSTYYVEFFFDEFDNADEGIGHLRKLTQQVKQALQQKVVAMEMLNSYNQQLQEIKLGHVKIFGFFHYNISVKLDAIPNTSRQRLVLQIYHGRPVYYHSIAANQPIASFNLVNAIKQTNSLFTFSSDTCKQLIPGFTCKGYRVTSDSAYLYYEKTGFLTANDAFFDFNYTFSNIAAGLGSDYVYWEVYTGNIQQKKMAFIPFKEVGRYPQHIIILTFFPNINYEQNGLIKKSASVIQLCFSH